MLTIDLSCEEAFICLRTLIILVCIGILNCWNALRGYLHHDTITLGTAPGRACELAKSSILFLALAGCYKRLSFARIAISAVPTGVLDATNCALPTGSCCASPQHRRFAACLAPRTSSATNSGSGSRDSNASIFAVGYLVSTANQSIT